MINPEPFDDVVVQTGFSGAALPLDRFHGLAHGNFHERFPRHLWHLPRDYELAIRWLRPSFLTRDHWTPGRKGMGIHGIAPLRYADQREARFHAARSRQRAHVCVRPDGL